jgi:PST family polysaccharide transporter
LGTGAAVAAAGAAALAPWFVGLLLGPGYDAAVPVFRLLLLVLPIIALATSIGIFVAVPRGHDRIVLFGTMAAGGTNLLLALPLARRFGASGMAMSVVIAEAVVATMLVVWYWRQRRRGAA